MTCRNNSFPEDVHVPAGRRGVASVTRYNARLVHFEDELGFLSSSSVAAYCLIENSLDWGVFLRCEPTLAVRHGTGHPRLRTQRHRRPVGRAGHGARHSVGCCGTADSVSISHLPTGRGYGGTMVPCSDHHKLPRLPIASPTNSPLISEHGSNTGTRTPSRYVAEDGRSDTPTPRRLLRRHQLTRRHA